MTETHLPRSDRGFVADAARMLAASPVEVPGHELRTADSGWVDLGAVSGDALTVTLFPVGDEQVDLDGCWIVAARPDDPYRYERLDRNGQCHFRGLARGRWAVRLLATDRPRSVPDDAEPSRTREVGRLLESVVDDDPIVCCEALDALRATADGDPWPAAMAEPIVRQLRANPEAIVRRAAAELLGAVGGVGAVEPLLAAADDAMWSVQQAAVWSLGLIASSAAVAKLVEISNNADRDPAVREAAEEALERLGETEWDTPTPVVERATPALPASSADAVQVAAGRFPEIDPAVGSVVEQDGVALLAHPDLFDADTLALAVAPGDALGGHIASLWAIGTVRVHSGAFDRLGQLRLRDVSARRYELRIHPPGRQPADRTVRDLSAQAATPVLVRGPSVATEQEFVAVLEVSDPDGRTMTIRRAADGSIIADVVGLGITDRRLVVRLPVRAAGGPEYLLAPLRWNHQTDRCGARLVLHDTDRLEGNGGLAIHSADTLGPEFADAVAVSVRRAYAETVDAWAALAADPGVHTRIASVIRAGRLPDADGSREPG
ncbi:HEAT repeat domain-containing protein [Actinocrispum wychmicini]|uniref:HEAT repeat protein n=1 Tax=Actinocrispum wychmicini TaxID=1213861 RepID=A0A4R2K746_9PSEU|nr:HEAT repeat domain-containing protein [Actinocrispum wychmicini]TCO62175.1 HEAT repeat protein [Actinocrispum wychmicini]